MKRILAFAGSNSSDSINKKLVTYAASHFADEETIILDLNEFDLPIYSKQLEASDGHSENAQRFLQEIKASDGIIISLAEYNGAYTSVFKNLFDWMSRIEQKLFFGKPLLLMATSPGGRGGKSVLEMAADRFPRHDANVVATFSLPAFNDNFSEGRIANDELDGELKDKLNIFKKELIHEHTA